MNRRYLLGFLGIGAAGQTINIPKTKRIPGDGFTVRGNCDGDSTSGGCFTEAGATDDKPANGECPVCGTMAEPRFIPYDKDPSYRAVFEILYRSKPVRCAHCNAAFWQDSENGK